MRKLIFAVATACLSISLQVSAQQIRIPVSQQGQAQLQTPKQGSSQQAVLASYGEPLKRHQSIGNPPITRWDYQDFSVYFEYKTVINSVKHHQPQGEQPAATDDKHS